MDVTVRAWSAAEAFSGFRMTSRRSDLTISRIMRGQSATSRTVSEVWANITSVLSGIYGSLDHISQGQGAFPGYDKVRGAALAEAFGAAVAADDFFDLLEAPEIHWSDLDGLIEFCPCGLRTSNVERKLLLDLFLVRSDHYRLPESSNRRASLLLVLDLISRWSPLEGYSPEQVFLASVYGRALSDGAPWAVASSLSESSALLGCLPTERAVVLGSPGSLRGSLS